MISTSPRRSRSNRPGADAPAKPGLDGLRNAGKTRLERSTVAAATRALSRWCSPSSAVSEERPAAVEPSDRSGARGPRGLLDRRERVVADGPEDERHRALRDPRLLARDVASSVAPSRSVWSSAIDVIAVATGGAGTTLVASSRPPMPDLDDREVDLRVAKGEERRER